jgi:hypothetical protein
MPSRSLPKISGWRNAGKTLIGDTDRLRIREGGEVMALTKWDEYLIHQIPGTIDTVGSDDIHFMDRMAFITHNADGTLYLFAGLGSYPNANVMDGFVCVRHKQMQRNIRVSRHLNNDRAKTEVGVFRVEVLEPLKRWGIHLGENELGIGCSLEFNGRFPPYLQTPENAKGVQSHYNQVGYYSGGISMDDQKFQVDRFIGVRDRSWGVRGPGIMRIFDVYFWIHAHFPGFTLSLTYLDTLGDHHKVRQGAILKDDGSVIPIVRVRHRIEFLTKSKIYTKVTLLVEDAQGKERVLIARPISSPAYLAGAGYDDRHGLDRGPLHVEGEEWDVFEVVKSDPSRFLYLHYVADFQLDQALGTGLIESSFGYPEDWRYEPTL